MNKHLIPAHLLLCLLGLMITLNACSDEAQTTIGMDRGIADSLARDDSIRWRNLMEDHLSEQLIIRKTYDSIYQHKIDSAAQLKKALLAPRRRYSPPIIPAQQP